MERQVERLLDMISDIDVRDSFWSVLQLGCISDYGFFLTFAIRMTCLFL